MQEGFIARLARGLGYAVSGGEAASWFGPQAPLPPAAPPEVAGRQFDYPFGFNLAVTPRNHEPTGFAELRGLADSYDLLRCVIETRKDQVERLTWHIRKRPGFRVQASDAARIAALAGFFARPDKLHAWPTWLRMLLEDLLVIDAPTLYLRRARGGALWALEVLDGATIKRLIDPWGRTPAPPDPAYQQILKGVPAVDYTAEELIYAPRNCRAHKAYGFSPVEQVQMSVNIALRRQIYQLQYYTEGNIPEALIGVPDSWNPDQIRQFQSYWDALNAGDTAERRHAKFVPGGVAKTFIPTRETELPLCHLSDAARFHPDGCAFRLRAGDRGQYRDRLAEMARRDSRRGVAALHPRLSGLHRRSVLGKDQGGEQIGSRRREYQPGADCA